MDPPRFLPDVPFPPYTYVPGCTPHPVSDPAGHMFGESPETAKLVVDDWPRCTVYLRGLDLFNHGYYWEAHEAWEALWHAAGRTGPIADFLKGLIKLAAAGVKTLEGSSTGRIRHARRAAELFRTAAAAGGPSTSSIAHMMGLSLDQLAVFAERLTNDDIAPEVHDGQVGPIFPVILAPDGTDQHLIPEDDCHGA